MNVLRSEIAKNEAEIQDKESRNERQAQEGVQQSKADLATAKKFIASKLQLRDDLLQRYKQMAGHQILRNRQMTEALRAACVDRGLVEKQ